MGSADTPERTSATDFGCDHGRDIIDDVWFFADAVAEAAAELGAAATDVEKGETS